MRATASRIAFVAALAAARLAFAQADSLPSWNDGPAKQAIAEFVRKSTTAGSSEFVAPEARIAVFDNDGTLWSEQPLYFQAQFALDRVKALAPQHPEWKTKEPFKSVLAGDVKAALATGDKGMAQLLAATHAGMTTDEFQKVVADWLATAQHPRWKRPYDQCIYQPMLELLQVLRANGFKTYIVSGGGVEFMRVWAEKAYGIPPEQVVGSSGKLRFELRSGTPVIAKLPQIDFVDDGPGKPVGIQKFIGRRPVLAFGNSDGDREMLEWVTAGAGARFAGLVHHTDAEREWAYDRKSAVGKLDKAWDEASQKGWTVVDMKADWKVVYPDVK